MSRVIVVSCNYNGNKFVKKCVTSVFRQTLQPDFHYFIDDISSDGCLDYVYETKKELNIDYLNVVKNKQKKYKIRNLFELINSDLIQDDDIIINLDGDDWLFNEHVIKEIKETYDNKDIDYLYSNFVFSHNYYLGISKEISSDNWCPYRNSWITSHISTFKAKNFRNIKKENFLDSEGNWFKMGCDQAYILPILYNIKKEYKNYNKVGFLNKPLYVYNHLENPSKPRDGKLGRIAHDAVTVIRKRGYLQ